MLSRGQGVNQPRPALACHPVGPIRPEKLNYFVHATSRPAPRSLGKPQQYLGLQSGLNQAVFTNKIKVTLPPPQPAPKLGDTAVSSGRLQTPDP